MGILTEKYTHLQTVSKTGNCDVSLVQSARDSGKYLVKTINAGSASSSQIEIRRRFCREMDIVSSLDHPNIIRPAETHIDGDVFSIVYPYERGATLSDLIEKQEIHPELEVLQIAKQLLSALEYIHSRDIIHADINPFNVYLTENRRVMLLDFGFSMTEEEARCLPGGRIIGTFPYLSPEQMGFTDFKIDTRTDLYCLLVIMYRMLSGKLPFPMERQNLRELLDATLKREIFGIPHIPQCLNEVLIRGLRPYPGDRYQTAEGLLWDIMHVAEVLKAHRSGTFCTGVKDVVAVVNRKRLFVERNSELDILTKGLNRLLKGKQATYLLSGKSGIGKTEIVKEFRTTILNRRADFITVKCNRFSPSQPYSVIRQLIIEYCSQKNSADHEQVRLIRECLNNRLAPLSGLLCTIIPELKGWFDLVGDIAVIEHEKEADRVLYVLSTLLAELCRLKKTVFFIDDVQWVDKITLSVIESMMAEKVPCMLLCNYRTTDSADVQFCFGKDLSKLPFSRHVRVKAFDRDAIAAVLFKRFETIHGSCDLVDVLYRTTEGIPFVLTEALRYLVKNNALVYRERTWWCDEAVVAGLPEKFDPVSMVVGKLDDLADDEKNVLSAASLVEGRFDNELIKALAGGNENDNHALMIKLEQFGFITSDLAGGYLFQHDRIQEAIATGLPDDTRYALFEKLGEYYLRNPIDNGDNLFRAAECYLKSRNFKRAVEVSYQAAFFATESIAFDVAVRYFRNVLFIADIVPAETIDPSVDFVKASVTFGNVLMMTGAQDQALKIFHRLLSSDKLDRFRRIEIVYKIGCIHHSTGAFEKSAPYFIDALRTLGIRVPERNGGIIARLISEILRMILRPRWIPRWGRELSGDERLLTIRILNKLAYSMYFTHMVVSMYLQFLANRLAEDTVDSYEKAEAYSMHGIAAYQLTRRRRSFWALSRAEAIAEKINRSDMIAFVKSFSGLCRYYNASWKRSEADLHESIRIFNSIGDANNQIISSEHLWKLHLMRGRFDTALAEMNRTIDTCRKVNEQFFLVVTCAALNYIMYLKTGVVNRERLDDINERLRNVDSALFHLEAGGYLLQAEIERGEYQAAYTRAMNLLQIIFRKCINSEYQIRDYSLFCQLIAIELRNRSKGARGIDIPSGKLRRQLFVYSCIHFASSFNYPAYRGSFYRTTAWVAAMLRLKRIAGFLFRKAIRVHHRRDMRFEEACSIRDYAEFLDGYCDRPGDARDQYETAVRLFDECGAKMHSDRCRMRIGNTLPGGADEEDIGTAEEGGGRHSSSGVNLVRFETLAEVSTTITETDDPAVLLRQILKAMITVTGAQYGCFFINQNSYSGYEPFALSFEGYDVPLSSVPIFKELVNKVEEIHSLETSGETVISEECDTDFVPVRSDLCVPLNWRDKYLGYVYLVNERVKGLFGEGAQKSALILAAHAGILLENIQLMTRQKKFNEHLSQQVAAQTEDIRNKSLQLEEANLRLMESERMKGILSGTLVHDIKNYAAGISGNVEYLSRRIGQDQKSRRIIDVVGETCSDISSLASNLLDIAKMDDGKMVVRADTLDCGFFEAMCEKFGRGTLFEEKEITPRVILPGRDVEVFADVYLLERVLQNLFSNAAKYAPRGSRVEIRFLREDDEEVICFYNSGVPIPESEKDVLFEKYARLKSRKSQYSKGLGLFFCRMVLNAHNGRIWLDTDENGNYFKMAFPSRSNIIPFAAA